ncbi:MAG: sulfatase-like hydrolase/transferase, partial [Planctomycetes bacterium]|nr:sulfatase-like hydrolase/transferase [Planctomycetota bacterium]
MRWLVLLSLAVLGPACSSSEAPKEFPKPGRGVLVIEVDAWRRDHLSLYGYDKPTTPFLENLARRVVVFDNAWSTGAGAMPAAVSLLTGCDPIVARRPQIALADGSYLDPAFPWDVTDPMPRIAFQFLLGGYRTLLLAGGGKLENVRGLRLGFEDVRWSARNASGGAQDRGLADLEAELLEWARHLEDGQDWFAYLQASDLEGFHKSGAVTPGFEYEKGLDYVPPVGPGEPVFHALPPSRVAPGLETLADHVGAYDSALARFDADLEHLLLNMGETGVLSRTTVVVVGGYGMGFGESGLLADAGTLSEVDLAVPLLIRPAPELEFPVGQRLAGLTSLVDLGPTLLTMHGQQVPDGLAGRSLTGLMRGEQEFVRERAFAVGDIHAGFAVIDGRGMWIWSQPQVGGAPGLGRSWFGRDVPRGEAVEILLPRGVGLQADAYRLGVEDAAWLQSLRPAG